MEGIRRRSLVTALAVLAGVCALFMISTSRASAADFEIQFNNGQMSLGNLGNIPLGTGSGTVTTFSGQVNGENVTVPRDSIALPHFGIDEGIISGSVGFIANGNGTGKYYPATGQFNLRTSLALNITINNVGEIIEMIPPELLGEYGDLISLLSGLERLSCSLSPLVLDFTTEASTPFAGKRFSEGFDGDGAVAATWEETPPITGGVPINTGLPGWLEQQALNFICPQIANFTGLNDQVPDSEGSIQLRRDVTPPAAVTEPPVSEGAASLTGSGLVGQRLDCVSGGWADADRTGILWFRGGEPIEDNIGPGGSTYRYYVPKAGDTGQAITCAEMAVNDYGRSYSDPSDPATVGSSLPVVDQAPVLTTSVGTGEQVVEDWLAGNQLRCQAGSYSNPADNPWIGRITEWLQDDAVFENNGPSGSARMLYNSSAGDAGTQIVCQQTARNIYGDTLAASNGVNLLASLD